MIIRPFKQNDVDKICEIYNYFVKNTAITFEENALTVSEMSSRIISYTKLYPWLVCEVADEVVGYAYASKWKERSAYKNTAEVTVYVKQGLSRKGYGKALYASLLQSLKELNCHVILGCIALPNESSEKLHEHFGFVRVAHFSEVGFKLGQWVDVGYWQRIIR